MTKKYKIYHLIFLILSLLCTFVPIIAIFIIGLCKGEVGTAQKFTLSIGTIVAIIITAMGFIIKKHWRTPLWIFVGACYLALERFGPILITFAVTTFAEELIFTPLAKYYKDLYVINREIDKRGA